MIFHIYNDHVTSFFMDHYSPFVMGIDTEYVTADEGGGRREYPPVKGHAELASHIGHSLFADEFDISFFQKRPVDHGLFSPLSMMTDRGKAWNEAVIPFQVGVLQYPVPTANRCYRLGRALRRRRRELPRGLEGGDRRDRRPVPPGARPSGPATTTWIGTTGFSTCWRTTPGRSPKSPTPNTPNGADSRAPR